MAEQISTVIDTSDLVGGETINKTILDSQEEEKNKEKEVISETLIDESKLVGGEEIQSTIDTSDLVGGETIDDTLTTDTTSTIDTSDLVGGENATTGEAFTEPSTWEKLEYGWDKERWVAGDVLRIAKAVIQGGLDKDKTFKDYAIENEIKKVEDFEKEHWKMLDGKYDGKYTTIGKAVSWLSDPYYLAGYYFGRGLLTTPLTSMAFNAALIGGGNAIHQLAQKGEVDWVEAGMSAGVGGTIGLAFPIAGNIIKKYLPSATKKEALRIEEWINNKVAQKNNLEPHELAKLRKVSEAAPVKKLTNDLDKWAVNYYSRSVKEINKLNKLERELISERSAIYQTTKSIIQKVKQRKYNPLKAKEIRKAGATQIAEKRQLIKEARKAFDESQIKNIKIQSTRQDKYYALEGKRLAAIMEQINATDNFANKALKAVMANITRPAAFGAIGGGGNVLFGEEEDFWTWVGTGVAFGAAQKGIMSSKTLTIGQKNTINGWIINDATKFTLQKTRDILAGTTFSKLASYGGPLEKFAKFMMRGVDESLSSQSVAAQHMKMQNHWLDRINTMIGTASKEEMAAANSINRGNFKLRNNSTEKVKNLADEIKVFLNDFQNFTTKAGIVSKVEIQNYFPRVLDYVKVNSSKESEAAAIKTIAEIYKLKGVQGNITKKTLKSGGTNPDYGRDKATVYAENYLAGHKNGYDSVVNGAAFADIIKRGSTLKTAQRLAKEKELIYTPVSDHIAHNRSLTGPYEKVEAILERDGLLINDTRDILNKLVNDTVRSVAFSRKFGTHGELLKPILDDIIRKYRGSTLNESQQTMGIAKEADLMMKSIDAYFNRFGASGRNQLKSSMGIVAMLSNLNMLGRVTISSLGDLVQPVQHSSKWTSAIRGLLSTNFFRAQWEKGQARNLNYHFTDEMNKAVFKSAGLEGNEVAFRQGFMGNWRNYGKDLGKTATWNSFAFKALGLEWLTGYARRFAYNTAAIDAHLLARSYVKAVQKNGANSNAALRILDDLTKYNIKANQALTIGRYSKFDSAIKNKVSKESLNEAGMIGSNRDALIPQPDNRLLFTQSQVPWIRILGQFLSWAQAKSAQTNKILMRVESGDARQLIKTLAVIPVYGGIQQLREIAKYGEVHTHPDYDMAKFLAKSGQLSGMPGWLVDLFMNRFLGPGKRDPWFNFAPAFSIMGSAGTAVKQVLDKKPDQAMQTLSKRFLPLPNWRRWIKRWWFDLPELKGTDVGPKVTFSKGGRIGYEQGDVARQNFSIGKIASKIGVASLKKLKVLDDVASQETAISNTINTYKKVDNMLTDLNKVSVHDAGSGLGYGKDIFTKSSNPKVYSGHDPYSKKIKDKIAKETKEFEGQLFKGHVNKHENFDEVFAAYGTGSKDAVVNLNVLNVIGDLAERQKVVKDISKLINNNGVAVITTRGWKNDVLAQAQKHYGNDWKKHLINDGFIFKKGNKKTFQTGFDNTGDKKLTTYVREILGDNFLVQRIPSKYNISSTGVMISKVKDKLSNLKNEVTKIDSSLKRNSSTGVGKKIGGALYVHKSSENVIPTITFAKAKLPKDYNYDVVKYNDKDKIVSFIKVPEFNTVNEPLATTGLKVFSDGTIKNININQIYHHKWLFVDDSYKGFNVADSIERSLAWLPLRKNNKIKNFKWASIGKQEAWDKVIPFIPKLSVGGQVARLGLSNGDIIDTFERKFNRGGRIGYEQGEEVILPRKKPMNKKDLAAAVMAATIATTGVNADINKAVENNILPPHVEEKSNLLKEEISEVEAYVPLIKEEEGHGDEIKDSKGNVVAYKNYRLGDEKHITSGYGFYDKSNREQDAVTVEQAEKDLRKNILIKLKNAKERITKFDSLSNNLKKQIVSSWYRGSLSGSPDTIDFINAGEWAKAADEFLKNDEYRAAIKPDAKNPGVAIRMKAVSDALRNEANKTERQTFRIGGDPTIKRSEIADINLDVSTEESAISQVPGEIDKMIEQKEAQKMLIDDSSLEAKLDKDIQKLKELQNKQLVAV